jgi:diacylglycerol kinase family enzyme
VCQRRDSSARFSLFSVWTTHGLSRAHHKEAQSGRLRSMQVTLIYNPKAGQAEAADGKLIAGLIREAGHEVVYESSKNGHWEKALEEPGDIVAIAGGDGTVNKVARRLFGRGIPVAILPAGTANNVATSLGLIDKPIDQLIAGWNEAVRVKLDMGVAVGPWGSRVFIQSLGVGFFARMMSKLDDSDSPEKDLLDDSSDPVTTVQRILRKRLQSHPASRLTVTLDGNDLSGDYVLLEAMNVPCIGPNLQLAPDADSGDGLLDVVLLSDEERSRLDELLFDSIKGNAPPAPLTVVRGKELHILGSELRIHVDDKTLPRCTSTKCVRTDRVDVNVCPGALEFLLPAHNLFARLHARSRSSDVQECLAARR